MFAEINMLKYYDRFSNPTTIIKFKRKSQFYIYNISQITHELFSVTYLYV